MATDEVNLAALWVPIMPETSHMLEKMAVVGKEAGAIAGTEAGNTFNITFRQTSAKAVEESRALGGKMGAGLLEGLQRSGVGARMNEYMGGFKLSTFGAAAAVTGLVVGLEKMGKALIDVGEEFENINRQVTLMTNATGPQLDDMKSRVDNLVGTLDTGTGKLGEDFAILHQRLGLTGDGLDTVTRHVEELRDRFGELNTSNFAGAMLQFSVAGKDADATLASLTQSSREFGVNLGKVVDDVAEAGPALRELGLNAQQAGYMMAEMESMGLGGAAGPQMLARAEKANVQLNEKLGLHRTIGDFIAQENAAIQQLGDSGNEAAAQEEAFFAYGVRNWPLAIKASQAYADTLKKTPEELRASGGDIDELTEKTKTLHNEWERLINMLHDMFRPEAEFMLDWMTKMTRGLEAGGGHGFWHWLTHSNEAPPDLPEPPAPPGSPGTPGGPPAPGGQQAPLAPGNPKARHWVPDANSPGGGYYQQGVAPAAPGGVALKDKSTPTDIASLKAYIIQRGQALGLTPTEIGMALAVQTHEGLGPTGLPSMGFGPEAKNKGFNFDMDPQGAIDQFYKQYKDRLPPGLDRNNPQAIADYIWHTVHGAADTRYGPELMGAYGGPAGGPSGAAPPAAPAAPPAPRSWQDMLLPPAAPGPSLAGAPAGGGLNLSTIPVAAQKYANDCIDASARLILSHSGINMSEDQLENVIAPGGTIESQAAGLNKLYPQGKFAAMPGSGGSVAAMFNAIKASVDSGTGSILNVAPGSSIAGRNFGEGHFIAATGYNADGTINLSDTARGTQYSVSAADAFQATQGRGIVAGMGSGPLPQSGPSPGAPSMPFSWGGKGKGKGGGAPDPSKVDATQTQRNRALRDAGENVEDEQEAVRKYTEDLKAADAAIVAATEALANAPANSSQYQEAQAALTKATKDHAEAYKGLKRSNERLQDAQDAQRVAGDKENEPIGGAKGGGGGGSAESFGSGLLKGLFDEIGLPGAKSILDWPTFKLGMGLLNYGLSGLSPGKGGGAPFQGGAPGAPGGAGGPGLPGLPGWKSGAPGGAPGAGAGAGAYGSLYIDQSLNVQHHGPSMDTNDLQAMHNGMKAAQATVNTPGALPAQ